MPIGFLVLTGKFVVWLTISCAVMAAVIAHSGSAPIGHSQEDRPVPLVVPEEDSPFQLMPYEVTAVPGAPSSIVIGDISGDGLNDLALSTVYVDDPDNDYHIFLFRQGPNGELLEPVKFPYLGVTPTWAAMAVADLDGSQGLDLVVGHYQGITVFLANESGLLEDGELLETHRSALLANLSQLALPVDDIVSLSNGEGLIYLNDGSGALTESEWPITVSGPAGMATIDFDRDGREDLVVSAPASLQGDPNLFLYRNRGSGSLEPAGAYEAYCADYWQVEDVAVGYLNNDRWPDIVASGGGNGDTACLFILYGLGEWAFDDPVRLPSYEIPQTIRVSDINRDRRDDIVVLHGGWGRVGVYLQNRDGSISSERLFPVPYTSHYFPYSMSVGDIDGDGCPDVAVADHNGLVTLKGSGCEILFYDGFEGH